jgi:predicted amidohydrolase
MKLAAIQLCSGVDIFENIARASDLIRAAAAKGASFIATPEMTNIIQRSPKRLHSVISPQDSAAEVAAFSALAAELSVNLLIGSMAFKSGEGRAVNRAVLFGSKGQILAQYDKIHLFDVTISRAETWKESSVYDRGEQAVIADMDGVKLGLSICYDLRFAGLYRHYGQAGAHIISAPAAFTVPTGQAHWETLLRARAIETGSFIIAPAQGGHHVDGRTTWGHSMIIGPWGDIRAELPHNEPGYSLAEINLDDVTAARAKIPAWNYNPDYSY